MERAELHFKENSRAATAPAPMTPHYYGVQPLLRADMMKSYDGLLTLR